jgi:hypothetical protein
MTHVRVAPTGSVTPLTEARTANTCEPADKTPVVVGEVHAAKTAESRLQVNVAVGLPGEVKANVATVELVGEPWLGVSVVLGGVTHTKLDGLHTWPPLQFALVKHPRHVPLLGSHTGVGPPQLAFAFALGNVAVVRVESSALSSKQSLSSSVSA